MMMIATDQETTTVRTSTSTGGADLATFSSSSSCPCQHLQHCESEDDPALEPCQDVCCTCCCRSHATQSQPVQQQEQPQETPAEQVCRAAVHFAKRTVRFQAEHDVFFRGGNFDKISISDLWCTEAHYKTFKDAYRKDAKELVKYNMEHDAHIVSQAFEECCSCSPNEDLPFHVTQALSDYLHSFPKSTSTTSSTTSSTSSCTTSKQEGKRRRRTRGISTGATTTTTTGLERIASKEVFQDKRQRREMILEAVLIIQEHSYESITQQQHFLAMACQEMSNPHRLLAQAIAQAAVLQESSSS